MTEATTAVKPPRSFYIVGALALIWNLMGVAAYLMSVTMNESALASMPEAERALYLNMPAWATAAYAVAVFGGALASVGLLMRKAWAVPVFLVSLVAILVQMGHALFGTNVLEVKGASAAVMPVVVLLAGVALWWYAKGAKEKGWVG